LSNHGIDTVGELGWDNRRESIRDDDPILARFPDGPRALAAELVPYHPPCIRVVVQTKPIVNVVGRQLVSCTGLEARPRQLPCDLIRPLPLEPLFEGMTDRGRLVWMRCPYHLLARLSVPTDASDGDALGSKTEWRFATIGELPLRVGPHVIESLLRLLLGPELVDHLHDVLDELTIDVVLELLQQIEDLDSAFLQFRLVDGGIQRATGETGCVLTDVEIYLDARRLPAGPVVVGLLQDFVVELIFPVEEAQDGVCVRREVEGLDDQEIRGSVVGNRGFRDEEAVHVSRVIELSGPALALQEGQAGRLVFERVRVVVGPAEHPDPEPVFRVPADLLDLDDHFRGRRDLEVLPLRASRLGSAGEELEVRREDADEVCLQVRGPRDLDDPVKGPFGRLGQGDGHRRC